MSLSANNRLLKAAPASQAGGPKSIFDKRLKLQMELLRACIRSGQSLPDALEQRSLTYDDLVYSEGFIPPLKDKRYLQLDEFREKKNNIPVVSFFSGAGGLDLGLEAAGFEHQILFESNDLFCETLRQNRPKWNVISADVSKTEVMTELLRSAIGKGPFQGLFVGGPPCQPFSIAANQRFSKSGENFKRVGFSHETNGNLFFEYIELIKRFRPAAFLIENVPGLIDVDGGEQLERAYLELEAAGFKIHEPLILKADYHNVPQQRIRLFIIGTRLGNDFLPPTPTHRSLSVGPVFNLDLSGVEGHITREHSAESILRYMMLPYGARDKLGRVDRLDPNAPSKTVIAGGSKGGGRSHLHPYIPRTLSVRECARIQTFPDSYAFCGAVARQFTQVGNAVPPVLAAQIGKAIRKSFF